MWWPWRSLGVFVHLHPEVGGRGHGINLWYQATEVAKFSSAELCVCERYVYSGTLFSLRKRRIVNFIQACPPALE